MKNVNARTVAGKLYIDALTAMIPFSVLSLALLAIRIVVTGELQYAFLVWNLFLAWVPAVLAQRISGFSGKRLRIRYVAVIALWLFFLPNTFYILSDLIHLDTLGGVSKLYDAVMIFAFSVTGFLLGLATIGIVQYWIRQYISEKTSWLFVGGVAFASSFAIYLGRYLRWNSWDIAFNPLGLLFDVSDRIINPAAHPKTFTTTFLFFGIISVSYVTIYFLGSRLRERLKSLR